MSATAERTAIGVTVNHIGDVARDQRDYLIHELYDPATGIVDDEATVEAGEYARQLARVWGVAVVMVVITGYVYDDETYSALEGVYGYYYAGENGGPGHYEWS